MRLQTHAVSIFSNSFFTILGLFMNGPHDLDQRDSHYLRALLKLAMSRTASLATREKALEFIKVATGKGIHPTKRQQRQIEGLQARLQHERDATGHEIATVTIGTAVQEITVPATQEAKEKPRYRLEALLASITGSNHPKPAPLPH